MTGRHISWSEAARVADQVHEDLERRRQEVNEREAEVMGGVQHGVIRDLRERIAELEEYKRVADEAATHNVETHNRQSRRIAEIERERDAAYAVMRRNGLAWAVKKIRRDGA